jgi:glycosyltransferase involved in cell wall biosynthesis
MYSRLRVLLLLNEFRTWYIARHLSYAAQLGIEDGLRANGVDCVTITSPWLPQALDFFRGKQFDQVWIAGRLDVLPEPALDRLAAMAPVRLGLLGESLEYSEEECRVAPMLRNRKQTTQSRFQYLTHLAACDEKDADSLNASGIIPAIWWPQAVPERFISENVVGPSIKQAVFYGNRYGPRRHWFEHEELKPFLTHRGSPELTTVYPWLFTALHLAVTPPLGWVLPRTEQSLGVYLSRLRTVRVHCFELWLKGLQAAGAVVNLPHFVKTYAGRVVEAMAAGSPVISWEIPDRPRNRQLFEDGREILLFRNDPHHLADQIDRVLRDRELANRLSANAREKIRGLHTAEIRIKQILGSLS